MEFNNIYAPTNREAKAFLPNHKQSSHSGMGGDFNTDHQAWYGSLAPDRAEVMRFSSKRVNFLVEWTTLPGMALLNLPGTPTNCPRNGHRPPIPDLIFAKNLRYTADQSCTSDPDAGHDSDHALITTLMSIAPYSLPPWSQLNSAKWDLLRHHNGKLDPHSLNFNTRDGWLQAAHTVAKPSKRQLTSQSHGANREPKASDSGPRKSPSTNYL